MALSTFLQEWKDQRFALAFLAGNIVLLEGWPRRLVAGFAGLIAALALPPVSFLPALAVAFPIMVWLIDGATGQGKRPRLGRLLVAFGVGWWFGFGYFLAGLWWLGVAFVVGGEDFIWLLPLGVFGLPAGLAIFFALGALIARLLWTGGAMRLVALTFGFGLSEYLRGHILTGFPWNAFGQVFADHLILAQSAAWIGTEGLGLVAILVFSAPATLATGRVRGASFTPSVIAGLTLLAMAAFGFARLLPTGGLVADPARIVFVPDVRLRVVQPNVAQTDKGKPRAGQDILNRHLALSARSDAAKPDSTQSDLAAAELASEITHLIWPEAPFPFVLDREPRALEMISRLLGPNGVLITGAIRAEDDPSVPRRFRYYNSIQVFAQDGLVGTYDKVHLVPFGEYIPWGDWLRRLGIQEFVDVIGGFSASPRRQPLDIPGLPSIVPVICFETIFPHELLTGDIGPAVFINVTNDAWFGRTPGPYQHLAQARLRAIEFGFPMVRAANSGISALIDPYGRDLERLPLDHSQIFDSRLPAPLAGTLYRATISYSFVSVMSVLGLFALLASIIERRRLSIAHVQK
jgi:apolipoprotein N-acyltransferase